jgi:hypothetical protein
MLRMKVTGLDGIERSLRDLQKRASSLTGPKPVGDVLTPEFVAANTRFKDVSSLMEAGGFTIASQGDFEAIPEDKLDAHIRAVSRFASWKAMLSEGAADYMKRELRL